MKKFNIKIMDAFIEVIPIKTETNVTEFFINGEFLSRKFENFKLETSLSPQFIWTADANDIIEKEIRLEIAKEVLGKPVYQLIYDNLSSFIAFAIIINLEI